MVCDYNVRQGLFFTSAKKMALKLTMQTSCKMHSNNCTKEQKKIKI